VKGFSFSFMEEKILYFFFYNALSRKFQKKRKEIKKMFVPLVLFGI